MLQKAVKRQQILNEIFPSQSCSRFDLARRLNINARMVGGSVDEFLHKDLPEVKP